MRHHVFGRKLGRTKDERKLLFRNLLTELILHGRVKTTVAKAKAVKPLIEKVVTKAKKARLAARQVTLGVQREVASVLPREAVLVLVNTIVPRFQNRTSGFSRILHLGARKGDRAEMVLLEWTDQMSKEADKTESPAGIKSITSTTSRKAKARDTRDTRGTRATRGILVRSKAKRSRKEKTK